MTIESHDASVDIIGSEREKWKPATRETADHSLPYITTIALLDGEVEAASLLPPQIDMAKQLGLRPVIEDEFKTLWWVPETAPQEDVRAYLRGLDRAEKALAQNLNKYLPLWEKCIPAEFKDGYTWDYSRFTRGERFVYQPLPREDFDMTMDQVKRWKLDDYLKETNFEKLVYRAPATV